jgi:hypothetical protein
MKHRRFCILLVVSMVLIFFSQASYSQFLPENHYLGPSIGLSFLGSVPEFGANYEYGMEIENFGLVGIGGIFRYWSYRTTWWSYTNIVLGAQGNYYFDVDMENISLFAGLVLAYYGGSVSWRGFDNGRFTTPGHGGLYLAAQGGGRYWFSPSMALSARFGVGTLSYYALTVGLDFRL